MIEVTGNLWTYPADARVITTNGTVKKDGSCVMGRGCALEAKTKYPYLAKQLGKAILDTGNHTRCLVEEPPNDLFLVAFPVKHNWWEKADLDLIKRSASELAVLTTANRWNTVVLPRPGCGNGKLKWEDVKQILEPVLDDRFHVITF